MEYHELSLAEASDLLFRGKVSSEELAQACLDRIRERDTEINAFITVTSDLARQAARAADTAREKGVWRGPLQGIPISLKDLFETRDVLTTAGSKLLAGYIPTQDCEVFHRLRSAGAVLLGKTNMHEFAFGVTSQNPHYGSVRNPWDLQRISGGSSGGAAAALAAGMCLGSLGTDTGGSIRIPASLCGVVGLKPTYGRVSVAGVIPLSRSLDHVGPLARTVTDVAILYQAISGHQPEDANGINFTHDGVQHPAHLRDYRIALATDPYFNAADNVVFEAVRAAASAFEALGARVEEDAFPEAEAAHRANVTLLLAEAAAYHARDMEQRPQDYSEDVLERLERGAAQIDEDVAQARTDQKELQNKFQGFFNDFDLLLTPATPGAASLIDQSDPLQAAPSYTRFTAPFNITGLPALSLPCGFTLEGLPIGLQLVARPGAEWKLLQAAYAYEQHAGWFRRHPA